MVRIAYFGTDGCPGHHVIPIRGKFTEEDVKVIESVDCDDFYKVFDVGRGLANQIKINKTIPVSHKPKEERRMMFVCGDDIASLIKRFENESK